MGEISGIPARIGVVVESDWWSRINWTQVIAFVLQAGSVVFGLKNNVSLETLGAISLVVQGIAGAMTIYFRRYTTSVTPAAALMIKEERAAAD